MPKKSVKLRILLGVLLLLPGLGAWTLVFTSPDLYSSNSIFLDFCAPFLISVLLLSFSAYYFYSAGKVSKNS